MTTPNRLLARLDAPHPLAITMWDFSWIERRWPGAGYEDWNQALDELQERGYDAVRIDAFPHLLSVDPDAEWQMEVLWGQMDWGSPVPIKLTRIADQLVEFMGLCKARNLKVALSSWFRQDKGDIRRRLHSPGNMAEAWIRTLDILAKADLLDTILFVDLCNEFPGSFWAPYFINQPPETSWGAWDNPAAERYMQTSVELTRQAYPDLPLCYSFNSKGRKPDKHPLGHMDLLEPHIWMVQANNNEFYRSIGSEGLDTRFSDIGWRRLQEKGRATYLERRDYWIEQLKVSIDLEAGGGVAHNLPLVTTECWSIIDYRDYPDLPWDYVLELCEIGTAHAAATGRWCALATSNFCGPQFHGMWRDVAWHRRLTDIIHSARLPVLR